MKTMIIALMLAVTVGVANAAPGGPGGHGGFHGGFYGGTRVIVTGGGFYNPYYSPFGMYYGYPYYPYGAVAARPSKLDMQVADIKNDYADRIESVRLDRSLTGKERRVKIREFRRERDEAVLEARSNYYKNAQ